MLKMRRKSIAYFALALVFLVLLGLMWNRLFYAMPNMDETYAVAEPYQIIVGNRPFADIWTPTQGASILLSPIIRLYRLVTGGMDGLMLFMRQAYFFSKIFFALLCILALKRKTGLFCAVLAVAPTIFLVPYSMPIMNYSATSADLALLSSILIFSSNSFSKRKFALFVSGVVSAVAAVFYPPLIVYVFFNVICIFVMYRQTSGNKIAFQSAKFYSIGAILSAGIFFAVFLAMAGGISGIAVGVRGILNSPNMENHSYAGLYDILHTYLLSYIIRHFKFVIIFIIAVSVIIGVLILLKRRISVHKNSLFIFVMYGLATCFAAFFFIIPLRPGSYFYVFYMLIAFAATAAAYFIDSKDDRRFYLFAMIIPAWCVFLVRTVATTNRNIFGQFVVVMPFIVCLIWFFYRKLSTSEIIKRVHRICVPIMSVIIASVCLLSFYTLIIPFPSPSEAADLYSISHFSTKIESGLFRGIYSEPEMAGDIQELEQAISSFSRTGKSVLVLDYFSAAYLMTNMTPHTPNTWSFLYGSNSDDYARLYFDITERSPDTIFVIRHEEVSYPIDDDDFEFNVYIARNYKQIHHYISNKFELIVFERT